MERIREMFFGFVVFLAVLGFLYIVSDKPSSGAEPALTVKEAGILEVSQIPGNSNSANIFNWYTKLRNQNSQAALNNRIPAPKKGFEQHRGFPIEKTAKVSSDRVSYLDIFYSIEKSQEKDL